MTAASTVRAGRRWWDRFASASGRATVCVAVAVLVLAVATASPAAASTERSATQGAPAAQQQSTEFVSSCTVIDTPGRYELTADIIDSTDAVCIDIQSSDVVFDGNGHTVDAAAASPDPQPIGVLADGSDAPLSNVTVRNVDLTDWWEAVVFESASDSHVEDVHAERVTGGIQIRSSDQPGPARDVTVSDASVNDTAGGGLFVWDTSGAVVTNVSVSNVGFQGVDVDDSRNVTLSEVSATAIGGTGFDVTATPNVTMTDATVVDANENGVNLHDSPNAELSDVSATTSGFHGFNVRNASNLEMTGVSAVDSGFEAIGIQGSEDVSLRDVTATDSRFQDGVGVDDSQHVAMVNVSARNNDQHGIHLDDSADVSIRSSTVLGSGQWAVFAEDTPAGFMAENLTVPSATLSFEGANVGLAGVDSPPADPTNRRNVGQYVNATDTGPDASLNLTVHYDDADASGVDESTLRVWRNDSTSWTEVPGSSVDAAANEVSGNGTSFGVLAPLGEPDGPPPVCDDCPPPTDPDGDGKYEDLDGDSEITFADINLLYERLVSGAEPITPFDFNDSDEIDFGDINLLYGELVG